MESSHPGRAEPLADQLAATLEPREPGWRLPRRGALARKHGVSLAEIDFAIGHLIRHALLRRLPDGQLYRTSPAGQWIPVEGTTGLPTRLDPMGNAIGCQAREVATLDAPPEVATALGLAAGTSVGSVRCEWSVDGEPAAVSTTYHRDASLVCPADDPEVAEVPDAAGTAVPEVLAVPDAAGTGFPPFAAAPTALTVTVARLVAAPADAGTATMLGMAPGWPAMTVTAVFREHPASAAAAMAIVTLRAALFRVAIEIAQLIRGP